MNIFPGRRALLLIILCALPVCPVASMGAEPPPDQKAWEYRLIPSSDLIRELMAKLKKEKVYNFEVTNDTYVLDLAASIALAPHINPFLTKRFNELGAHGWIFSGCTGEKNDTYVFRRPK